MNGKKDIQIIVISLTATQLYTKYNNFIWFNILNGSKISN